MSDALLAVPNVSEGRDPDVIDGLAGAFAIGAALLDPHTDPVHNRTVFTLAPRADAVSALTSGAEAAVAAIDLNRHEGEHPRIGALDVAPVVWLAPDGREPAREQAIAAGQAIADLDVPVFLYGELASSDERRERAYFRNGGLPALRERMESGELRARLRPGRAAPDRGRDAGHRPSAAGGVQPGARGRRPRGDAGGRGRAARVGRRPARRPGHRPGARGEPDAGLDQRPRPVAVPLAEVVAGRAPGRADTDAASSPRRSSGLVPRAALDGFPEDVPIPGFDARRGVIEERLAVQ